MTALHEAVEKMRAPRKTRMPRNDQASVQSERKWVGLTSEDLFRISCGDGRGDLYIPLGPIEMYLLAEAERILKRKNT